MNNRSPKIIQFSWGRVVVSGYETTFKDVKLFPGGAREWDWNETGTRHIPGIQPADIQELLDNGALKVILSQGMQKRLRITPEAVNELEKLSVETFILPTDDAVEKYNELVDSEQVGALIHSTC
jgi:hypothetical protein